MAVIDAHLHVVPSGLPGSKPGSGQGGPLLSLPPDQLAARLRPELKQSDTTRALALGRWAGPPDDPLGINGVLRLATLVPGLFPVGIADPGRTDADHLRRVEQQLARGQVKALKAYLGYLPFGPDHPGYAPYYRLAAQFGLPVILHTGDTWSTEARLKHVHPLLIDDVAVDHPDVKFVLAHFGNPWVFDAAEVIYKNENVWADLSGIVVGTEEQLDAHFQPDGHPRPHVASLYQRLRDAFYYAEKPDRFLYGSDWPLAPLATYRKIIEAIVPLHHHQAVLHDNAQALFRLP